MSDRTAGDLAIVLHSHMPYVEGFGTYPFGEEWLFEAFARSHLPVLEVAEHVTMTITPVLADQLEADGVGERLLAFLAEHRVEAATRDAAASEADLRPAAEASIQLYARAIERLESLEEHPLTAFQEAADSGRIVLIPSAATHAVLPKVATLAGRRLQVDAGLRSHERRFGAAAEGFWLPECAYVPGLEAILAERALGFTCLDQSAREDGTSALTPVRLPAWPGGLHDRLADRRARLVRARLSLGPELSRVPPPLAERDASAGRSREIPTTRPQRRIGRASTPRLSWARCATAWTSTGPVTAPGGCAYSRSTRNCSATGGPRAPPGFTRFCGGPRQRGFAS